MDQLAWRKLDAKGIHERDCEEHVYRNLVNLPLLRLADLGRGGLALDLGCGAGDNARLLAQRGWRVVGITLSPQERDIAAQVCVKVLVRNLDEGLPEDLDGPFDLVVLSHVLEHLRKPERVLAQVREVLAPGGEVAIAVPNVLNWHQRLLFLIGKFEYSDEGIMDATHVAFYTFKSARALIESTGFAVIKAGAAGSILPWGPLRRYLPGVTSSIDRLFCAVRPGLFGRQLVYLATPRR